MTMTIKDVLTVNRTIANNSASKITADKIGIDAYADWKFAVQMNYQMLYKYAEARHNYALDNNKPIDKAITDNAYKAVQALLDCIGEVNGHAIIKNEAMLNELVTAVYCDKKALVGDALLQKSIVDNLRTEINAIPNGASAEYVEKLTKEYETAKIKMNELKKLENSCNTYSQRTSLNAFTTKLEKILAMYVTDQSMKTWEELEAEEAERKQKSKEKAKARRQAKRQAEAQAKVQA